MTTTCSISKPVDNCVYGDDGLGGAPCKIQGMPSVLTSCNHSTSFSLASFDSVKFDSWVKSVPPRWVNHFVGSCLDYVGPKLPHPPQKIEGQKV